MLSPIDVPGTPHSFTSAVYPESEATLFLVATPPPGRVPDEGTPVNLSEAFQSDEIKAQILQDIRSLGGTIREIRASFQDVRRRLQLFDMERYRDTDDTLVQLAPEWDGYTAVSTLMESS